MEIDDGGIYMAARRCRMGYRDRVESALAAAGAIIAMANCRIAATDGFAGLKEADR